MAKQTFTTGQVLTAAQMTSLQQTAMGGGAATAKTASYVLVAADAGTTVAMNAAGATTITVNTGLFAAGDTVFIQNLGAGACTVTAGTATVATAGSLILPQNDAGILYFTSASAAIFYDYIQAGAVSPLTTKGDVYTFSTSDARLGVGANNTVLTADSSEATGLKWVAPASGGGMTYITNSTISAVTSHSVNNCFTSTYANYFLVFNFTTFGDASTDILFRFRASASDTTTNYKCQRLFGSGATASADSNSTGTDEFFLALGDSSYGSAAVVQLFNPQVADKSFFNSLNAGIYNGSMYQMTSAGLQNSSTQFDGFTVFSDAGETMTGTVRIYGYQNS